MTGPRTTSTAMVRGWRSDLAGLDAADDAERVELLGEIEALKSALCAAQARLALDLEASQCAAQRAAGVPESDVGRGVAAQVALARHESPAKGRRLLGLAHALAELPCTAAALAAGETTEWRATLVARETGWLSREDRLLVDAELAGRPGGLAALGDRGTEAETRRIGYRLDPAGAVRRCGKAEADRRVSLRPAPDTMSILTAVLPVREGVAAYAALSRAADTERATGGSRTRGQAMADTLVERVTGQARADEVPLEVHLVMNAPTLVGSAGPLGRGDRSGPPTALSSPDVPTLIHGHGLAPVEVPAPQARSWIRDTSAHVWLRRLYASPVDGSLVAMDARRRKFTGLLRRLVVLRDQTCRTPWCDAPIRHADHAERARDGGRTSTENAQGLCEACNQAKEAWGWRTRLRGGLVETTTPTDHRHTTGPPGVLGPPAPPRPLPRVDLIWHPTVELVA